MNFLNLVKHQTQTFTFDDRIFNRMVWLSDGIIEANFIQCKPKEGDIVIYNGSHYEIKNYTTQRNLYVLWVREV